ncbi:MAG: pilus assembly protein PilM, partial [Gemmatimonadaceae bacterium]|nr:pilus assembly protein PilM [Gemmatimonadaceae bacterium]
LTRDIGVGTKSFREDLQRDRGLGAEEAAQVVQGYDRSPALDATIENRGEEIAMGIERATAFLATNSRASGQLRAVWVCGGGARIPGLVEALGSRLRLPVEMANPLTNLRVRDGAFDPLVTDDVAPLLMLPIGLALRTAP